MRGSRGLGRLRVDPWQDDIEPGGQPVNSISNAKIYHSVDRGVSRQRNASLCCNDLDRR